MFCKKCGAEIPDGSGFCPKCGENLNGGSASKPKEKFKLPDTRGWISLGFQTLIFILLFVPFIDSGVSNSLLAVEAFKAHALFGVAKIFMIMSMCIYLFSLALNLIGLGIPSIVKKFAPLAMYGLFVFSQMFVFIGCCIMKGVTMGASWYIILVMVGVAVVYELIPKLFKVDEK